MASGISVFGITGLRGQFGWESNELHLQLYLLDPNNQLYPLMQKLFGTNPGDQPLLFPFPDSWGNTTNFAAWDVQFEAEEKGVQSETESLENFLLLESFPFIQGGLKLDVLFRPIDLSLGTHGIFIDDEAWDFAAQTMSLVGNNFGQNPNQLVWASDKTPITNITAIVKIIPKIEFAQRRVFASGTWAPVQYQMIGSVNQAILAAGASGDGMTENWPEQTVLLTGLPVVRRWRFDGQQIFQQGVKLAINATYDYCLDTGMTQYVTWNRLYRATNAAGTASGWDTIYVGPKKTDGTYNTLYQLADLAQVF
jgi:hypothetical protein